MAERRRLGLTAVGFDNGREQMAAAKGMNIGYVAVDAVRPNFVIYRSRFGSVPEDPICKYAVIRVGLMGGGHSEPFPTRGEARCGLVTRAEACRMLEQRGYSNTTLARRSAKADPSPRGTRATPVEKLFEYRTTCGILAIRPMAAV